MTLAWIEAFNEKGVTFYNNFWEHLDSGRRIEGNAVTYSFLTNADGRENADLVSFGEELSFSQFSEDEQQFVRDFLSSLSKAINLRFIEAEEENAGTLGFGKHNTDLPGYADYPGADKQGIFLDLDLALQDRKSGFERALVQQTLKALGLQEPGNYSGIPNAPFEGDLLPKFDSGLVSILSKNESTARYGDIELTVKTPQALDYKALQEIYGRSELTIATVFNIQNFDYDEYRDPIWSVFELGFSSTGYATQGDNWVNARDLVLDDPDARVTFDFSRGLYLELDQYLQYDFVQDETQDLTAGLEQTPVPVFFIYPESVIRRYFGTDHSDQVIGDEKSQIIFGGDGDDRIKPGYGPDRVDGGAGHDVVEFLGNKENYTVTMTAGPLYVDYRFRDEGFDYVTGVERFEFSDGAMDLSDFLGTQKVNSEEFLDLAKLYSAYFNRAADATGLYFWADKLGEGMSMREIADFFFDQDETRAMYPDPSDTDAFVTQVYRNVLGRTPDEAGEQFWKAHLGSGNVTQGQFVLEILAGAQGNDIAYLDNKAALGVKFSAISGLSDVQEAADVFDAFGDQETSDLNAALNAIARHSEDAENNREFLFKLGANLIDDPFNAMA